MGFFQIARANRFRQLFNIGMTSPLKLPKNSVSLLLGTLLMASGTAFAQTPQSVRIQGDLIELKAGNLSIKSLAGETLELKVADPLRVLAISPTDFSSIKPHGYVAVTALPQADGSLLASRINLFPESMRGVGEGHRPMAAQPGNTMTNATVLAVSAGSPAGNTMTNATVTGVVNSTQTRKLSVQYPGGEKQVLVPPGLPIMMMESIQHSALVPGVHVTVTATRLGDGEWTTNSITMGKNGTVPPT